MKRDVGLRGAYADTSCPTGKRKYLTWTHAEHDARTMRRNNKRTNAKPYHCTTCHHTHVGGA